MLECLTRGCNRSISPSSTAVLPSLKRVAAAALGRSGGRRRDTSKKGGRHFLHDVLLLFPHTPAPPHFRKQYAKKLRKGGVLPEVRNSNRQRNHEVPIKRQRPMMPEFSSERYGGRNMWMMRCLCIFRRGGGFSTRRRHRFALQHRRSCRGPKNSVTNIPRMLPRDRLLTPYKMLPCTYIFRKNISEK